MSVDLQLRLIRFTNIHRPHSQPSSPHTVSIFHIQGPHSQPSSPHTVSTSTVHRASHPLYPLYPHPASTQPAIPSPPPAIHCLPFTGHSLPPTISPTIQPSTFTLCFCSIWHRLTFFVHHHGHTKSGRVRLEFRYPPDLSRPCLPTVHRLLSTVDIIHCLADHCLFSSISQSCNVHCPKSAVFRYTLSSRCLLTAV